jgi:hypothetical protein
MAACTGSSRPQATPDQIERIITTVDLHPNLPNCPLPRGRCSIAGTAVAAATAAGAPLAGPLPTQPSIGIDPQDLRVVPRLRPAGPGQRFAGIWSDRRRPVLGDHIVKSQIFLRAQSQTEGTFVRILNF